MPSQRDANQNQWDVMQAGVVHVVSGDNDQGHQPKDVPDDNGPGDPGANQATTE